MKNKMLDIIICPVCRKDLKLKAESQDEKDIKSGNLYCECCDIYYPIDSGIVNMLPPDVRYSY